MAGIKDNGALVTLGTVAVVAVAGVVARRQGSRGCGCQEGSGNKKRPSRIRMLISLSTVTGFDYKTIERNSKDLSDDELFADYQEVVLGKRPPVGKSRGSRGCGCVEEVTTTTDETIYSTTEYMGRDTCDLTFEQVRSMYVGCGLGPTSDVSLDGCNIVAPSDHGGGNVVLATEKEAGSRSWGYDQQDWKVGMGQQQQQQQQYERPTARTLSDNAAISEGRGGKYDVSLEGRYRKTVSSMDTALSWLDEEFDRIGVYYDVYFVNDHGNVDLIDTQGNIIASWV